MVVKADCKRLTQAGLCTLGREQPSGCSTVWCENPAGCAVREPKDWAAEDLARMVASMMPMSKDQRAQQLERVERASGAAHRAVLANAFTEAWEARQEARAEAMREFFRRHPGGV